jgi:hypothetical protein
VSCQCDTFHNPVFSLKLPSTDLCELESRPPTNHVFIEGSPSTSLSVHVAPSFADHPLLVGPRYQPEDIRCTWGMPLGKNVSGVFGTSSLLCFIITWKILELFTVF